MTDKQKEFAEQAEGVSVAFDSILEGVNKLGDATLALNIKDAFDGAKALITAQNGALSTQTVAYNAAVAANAQLFSRLSQQAGTQPDSQPQASYADINLTE